jgi:hypothetical protein
MIIQSINCGFRSETQTVLIFKIWLGPLTLFGKSLMLAFLKRPACVTGRFDSFVHIDPEVLVLGLLLSDIFLGGGYNEYQKAISKKKTSLQSYFSDL